MMMPLLVALGLACLCGASLLAAQLNHQVNGRLFPKQHDLALNVQRSV
jgi:hypothetical protein